MAKKNTLNVTGSIAVGDAAQTLAKLDKTVNSLGSAVELVIPVSFDQSQVIQKTKEAVAISHREYERAARLLMKQAKGSVVEFDRLWGQYQSTIASKGADRFKLEYEEISDGMGGTIKGPSKSAKLKGGTRNLGQIQRAAQKATDKIRDEVGNNARATVEAGTDQAVVALNKAAKTPRGTAMAGLFGAANTFKQAGNNPKAKAALQKAAGAVFKTLYEQIFNEEVVHGATEAAAHKAALFAVNTQSLPSVFPKTKSDPKWMSVRASAVKSAESDRLIRQQAEWDKEQEKEDDRLFNESERARKAADAKAAKEKKAQPMATRKLQREGSLESKTKAKLADLRDIYQKSAKAPSDQAAYEEAVTARLEQTYLSAYKINTEEGMDDAAARSAAEGMVVGVGGGALGTAAVANAEAKLNAKAAKQSSKADAKSLSKFSKSALKTRLENQFLEQGAIDSHADITDAFYKEELSNIAKDRKEGRLSKDQARLAKARLSNLTIQYPTEMAGEFRSKDEEAAYDRRLERDFDIERPDLRPGVEAKRSSLHRIAERKRKKAAAARARGGPDDENVAKNYETQALKAEREEAELGRLHDIYTKAMSDEQKSKGKGSAVLKRQEAEQNLRAAMRGGTTGRRGDKGFNQKWNYAMPQLAYGLEDFFQVIAMGQSPLRGFLSAANNLGPALSALGLAGGMSSIAVAGMLGVAAIFNRKADESKKKAEEWTDAISRLSEAFIDLENTRSHLGKSFIGAAGGAFDTMEIKMLREAIMHPGDTWGVFSSITRKQIAAVRNEDAIGGRFAQENSLMARAQIAEMFSELGSEMYHAFWSTKEAFFGSPGTPMKRNASNRYKTEDYENLKAKYESLRGPTGAAMAGGAIGAAAGLGAAMVLAGGAITATGVGALPGIGVMALGAAIGAAGGSVAGAYLGSHTKAVRENSERSVKNYEEAMKPGGYIHDSLKKQQELASQRERAVEIERESARIPEKLSTAFGMAAATERGTGMAGLRRGVAASYLEGRVAAESGIEESKIALSEGAKRIDPKVKELNKQITDLDEVAILADKASRGEKIQFKSQEQRDLYKDLMRNRNGAGEDHINVITNARDDIRDLQVRRDPLEEEKRLLAQRYRTSMVSSAAIAKAGQEMFKDPSWREMIVGAMSQRAGFAGVSTQGKLKEIELEYSNLADALMDENQGRNLKPEEIDQLRSSKDERKLQAILSDPMVQLLNSANEFSNVIMSVGKSMEIAGERAKQAGMTREHGEFLALSDAMKKAGLSAGSLSLDFQNMEQLERSLEAAINKGGFSAAQKKLMLDNLKDQMDLMRHNKFMGSAAVRAIQGSRGGYIDEFEYGGRSGRSLNVEGSASSIMEWRTQQMKEVDAMKDNTPEEIKLKQQARDAVEGATNRKLAQEIYSKYNLHEPRNVRMIDSEGLYKAIQESLTVDTAYELEANQLSELREIVRILSANPNLAAAMGQMNGQQQAIMNGMLGGQLQAPAGFGQGAGGGGILGNLINGAIQGAAGIFGIKIGMNGGLGGGAGSMVADVASNSQQMVAADMKPYLQEIAGHLSKALGYQADIAENTSGSVTAVTA